MPSKYYAVAVGRATGIYTSWDDCQVQVHKFKGAVFKSFKTMNEAKTFLTMHQPTILDEPFDRKRKLSQEERTPFELIESPKMTNRYDTTSSSYDKKRKIVPETSIQTHSTSISVTSSCEINAMLNFDGGSRGNPGLGGAGAFLRIIRTTKEANTATSTFKTNYYIRYYCGTKVTNNVAEYSGLLHGLEQLHACMISFLQKEERKDNSKGPVHATNSATIQIFGDSKLVIQQMKGTWNVENQVLKKLHKSCVELVKNIQSLCQVHLKFQHVTRDKNNAADALANEAMNERRSWTTILDEV